MPESSGLAGFFKEWGTLLLATYAVVQVWLIVLWKRFFRAGRLEIFEGGRLEIGYGGFGPTIGLNGTLRATQQSVFVSNMKLTLVKERDHSKHEFAWLAFRAAQLKLAPTDTIELELSAGFTVRLEQPHRYNIFFSDQATRTELEPCLLGVVQAWQELVKEHRDEAIDLVREKNVPADQVLEQLQAELSTSEAYGSAFDLLTRKNYWESGSYLLTVDVQTAKPGRSFSKAWRFSLNEQDFDRLRLNSVVTIRELCGLQVQYFFAFPEYQRPEEPSSA